MTKPLRMRVASLGILSALVGVLIPAVPGPVWAQRKPATAEAELDRKAYEAFARHDTNALASLKAAGGDLARHVRTDDKALFDALRPERSVAVLQFVLENGADPKHPGEEQWYRAPIAAAGLDLEKVRLLLDHGADPNAKGRDGYPAFFWVLFYQQSKAEFPAVPNWDQPARVYEKRAVVQLLLDRGIVLNRDYGGWGKAGALGYTRREDRDVIELLVAHGATLTDEKMGPVSTAIQSERDDLALVMLAHEQKLKDNDRHALVEAARHGYRDVVVALLRAGADANVADDAGVTALALAERRHDAAMAAALTTAGALKKAEAQPGVGRVRPDYREDGWDEFDSAVAVEIDDVALFDPPRFALGKWLPKRPITFVFYGKEAGEAETIECEQSSAFNIIAHANEVGNLNVGVCRRNVAQIRELVTAAAPAIDALFSMMGADGGLDETQARQMGWTYQKHPGANHSEQHYFPIIVIGHGIGAFWTLVLLPEQGDRAVLVQTDDLRLCEHQPAVVTPLCENTKTALSDIAERVLARVPLAPLAAATPSDSGGDISGAGILLNAMTGEPIAGGTVRIECRHAKLWDRPQVVQESTLTTDVQGEFQYAFSRSLKCQEFDVQAQKQGYTGTGSDCSAQADVKKYVELYRKKNGREFDPLPSVLCLTQDNDVIMQRLDETYRLSLGKTVSASGCSLDAADYMRIYQAFRTSKDLAKTATEVAFVREHYCERLSDLYPKLGADDLKYLQHFSFGPGASARMDHERDVVGYCAGDGATTPARDTAQGSIPRVSPRGQGAR